MCKSGWNSEGYGVDPEGLIGGERWAWGGDNPPAGEGSRRGLGPSLEKRSFCLKWRDLVLKIVKHDKIWAQFALASPPEILRNRPI